MLDMGMDESLKTATSVIEVNLLAVKRNIEKIRKHIGPDVEIMYIAKSNGYGNGLLEPAIYMRDKCGIKLFGTSQIGEAMLLRNAGITEPLMILSAVPYSAINAFVEGDFIATIYESEFAKALSDEAMKQDKQIEVHIKVDTGLHRFGVRPGTELKALLNKVSNLPGIRITGIFTHLCNGYSFDKTMTHKQTALFEEAISQLRAAGYNDFMIHMANTAGTVVSPECYYDAVRVAALVYGHDISPSIHNRLNLEKTSSWKCYVLDTRWVEAGEGVSYYSWHVTQRKTHIAIVSFGMGDGYIRAAVSRDIKRNSDVLINGRRARLIDLNFDCAFVDITDVPGNVKIGDACTIFGKDGDEEITTEEIAEKAGTSNGNVLASITSRPFRHYIYE